MYDTSHRYQSQLQVLPAQSIPSATPARFPTIASLLSSTPSPIPSLSSISTPSLGSVSVSLLNPTTTFNTLTTSPASPSALTSSFSKTTLSTSPMNLNNLNNLNNLSSINALNRSASPATSAEINDKDNSMSPQSHPNALATRDSPDSGKNRPLSTSKRAEQNRRAQRAFRERRDARVKHLEARAALLEETIAQADEANRRWEECRALVDRLRHENAMLRSALEQAGINVNGISSSTTSASRPSHSHSHSHSSSVNLSNGVEPSSFAARGGNVRDNAVDIHSTLQDTAINGADGHNKKRKRREADDDLRQ